MIDIEVAKLAVQSVGLLGTFAAAVVAVRTFQRTEKWKRAEFLAGKMKEFLDDPRVQQAMTLIDWSTRRVRLLDETAPDGGVVRVTRHLQMRALLPHTLLDDEAVGDAEGNLDGGMRTYAPAEAAIRDRFDAFLDGLERFAGYVESDLVAAHDLRPYLGYWVDDIHATTKDPDDAAWCAALLTYVDFYGYRGVQRLFARLQRPIGPQSAAYAGFLRQMRDQSLARRLALTVRATYELPAGTGSAELARQAAASTPAA
ncbi:MAG: hypothetical protein HY275_02780 [Gemmatimonadetes bacterium]|nr:hypothetical protein [Gemmatimonadota bacterium]